ncbi:iron complex transport system ATP-binding protein [Bowdeniella nasicola]|uniref:Iron complex transport system ATP-binding protein n=1 Tax=Bowdeniella nasicola TaxID=208480 RepID=A0A1H4DF81_9ACTO|nr:ABC transporter ATP-binding protein [Bowdeniella nasicola]SEA71079.1 iron complex transport system ATP-binding protein [Bowdeniella nasicola]
MTDEVLALDNVSVTRGDKTIIDSISLTVRDGERWVVLGPNGAGKTTVLQLATGRMYPTSGEVHILGEKLGRLDVAELRSRVGLASSALEGRIQGRERVKDVVMTAAYGMIGRWREAYDDFDETRAEDLLAAFGVAHLAERTFGTLSEGERKRVQVARALMSDPELLLLDEPAGGLDLGGREELMWALTEIAGDHRSPVIMLVTHHVEEIPAGFTHALLLRNGKKVADGPLEETLTPHLLSETFGLELEVERHRGRWAARAARR